MWGLSLVGIGSFLEKQIFKGVDDGRTDGQMDGPMPFIFKGLQNFDLSRSDDH